MTVSLFTTDCTRCLWESGNTSLRTSSLNYSRLMLGEQCSQFTTRGWQSVWLDYRRNSSVGTAVKTTKAVCGRESKHCKPPCLGACTPQVSRSTEARPMACSSSRWCSSTGLLQRLAAMQHISRNVFVPLIAVWISSESILELFHPEKCR